MGGGLVCFSFNYIHTRAAQYLQCVSLCITISWASHHPQRYCSIRTIYNLLTLKVFRFPSPFHSCQPGGLGGVTMCVWVWFFLLFLFFFCLHNTPVKMAIVWPRIFPPKLPVFFSRICVPTSRQAAPTHKPFTLSCVYVVCVWIEKTRRGQNWRINIYKQVQNIAAFIIFSGAVVILLCFSSMFLFCFVLFVVHCTW